MEPENHVDDVAYEMDGLQARLRQSRRRQNKVSGTITRVQGAINFFNAGLKENLEHREPSCDEEGRNKLNQLSIWMAERVIEARETQFKVSKLTIAIIHLVGEVRIMSLSGSLLPP